MPYPPGHDANPLLAKRTIQTASNLRKIGQEVFENQARYEKDFGMAAKAKREPSVVDVDRMPARHLGRPGADVGPLREAIQDRKPHAVTDISTEEQRRFWRRRLRKAAHEAGMRVQTVYVEAEGRLYFQGKDSGAADKR
jgi:hypothetical protein